MADLQTGDLVAGAVRTEERDFVANLAVYSSHVHKALVHGGPHEGTARSVNQNRRVVHGKAAHVTIAVADADIAGAHNAGWHTIYFNIKGTEKSDCADAEVLNLADVTGIL